MNAAVPAAETTTGARHGCTAPGCRSQRTTTVDGICGRRCATHPPRFLPDHAVNLVVAGFLGAAMAYVRVPLEGAS